MSLLLVLVLAAVTPPPDDMLERAAPFVEFCVPAMDAENPGNDVQPTGIACAGYVAGFVAAMNAANSAKGYANADGPVCYPSMSPRMVIDLAGVTYKLNSKLSKNPNATVPDLLFATFKRISPCP